MADLLLQAEADIDRHLLPAELRPVSLSNYLQVLRHLRRSTDEHSFHLVRTCGTPEFSAVITYDFHLQLRALLRRRGCGLGF
ncbi:MAG: hypothetical protein AAFS07_18820 [Pseudomonadota bacterium]